MKRASFLMASTASALVTHSLPRSIAGIRIPKLVYIASILHDTGLSPRYMSADRCFEVDGADVARSLLERHAIHDARADLVWDAVALHDNGGVARWKQPEVRLLHAGVSADFGDMLELSMIRKTIHSPPALARASASDSSPPDGRSGQLNVP